MSVAKVKRGKGHVWKVRYRDHSGGERAETYDLRVDADSRDAAIRQAKQRREPIPARGRGGNGQTFEDFARYEWWPQHVVGRRLAPKTQEWYGYLLDTHVVPHIGPDALAYIDVPRVLEVRADLAADDVGDYTSARALKLLRQVLGHAVAVGRLPYNPADVLRGRGALPSQARTTDVRPMAPEATEALRAKLLGRRTNGLRDATLVSVMAYAGLRPQEALALTWEHVGRDFLRVEHANKGGVIGRTKTSERRTVKPIIPALRDDLKAWRAACPDSSAGALVFGDEDGEPWSKTHYGNWRSRAFRPYVAKGFTPYSLRHGFASLLIRQGEDVATVADLMGNSPTMTTQHYTHVFKEYKGRRRETMATVVRKARSKLRAAGT